MTNKSKNIVIASLCLVGILGLSSCKLTVTSNNSSGVSNSSVATTTKAESETIRESPAETEATSETFVPESTSSTITADTKPISDLFRTMPIFNEASGFVADADTDVESLLNTSASSYYSLQELPDSKSEVKTYSDDKKMILYKFVMYMDDNANLSITNDGGICAGYSKSSGDTFTVVYGMKDKGATEDEAKIYAPAGNMVTYYALASTTASGDVVLMPIIAGGNKSDGATGFYMVRPVIKAMGFDVSGMAKLG